MSVPITDGFAGTVGNTPLIRLRSLSEATGCDILGKAEFLNPGGSVKDRAALAIIEAAEAAGQLAPGCTIVEGTAGNTGIGLTHVANAKGYKTLIVVPDTQSSEKLAFLRALGAEVRTVPVVPYKDPANYNHEARRLAEALPGAFWANQFDNLANREAHARTTGPEIWEQTGGRVSGVVAAIGTGGTLAGIAQFLKGQRPAIRTAAVDPDGAAMWAWIKHGTLAASGTSITEGIGQNRVTQNIAGAPIDEAYRVSDRLVVEMVHFLLRTEGLFLGSSAAINACGAYLLARDLGPGHVIVTILCDGGGRYVSRLFNPGWLAEKGLTPRARAAEFLADIEQENR